MAVTDIIWPLLVRGLIKPLASLVFSGMSGSELLYQYVIVFTSCFVSECYDFQLFFSFLMLGPALWIVIYRSMFLKKARIIADIEASKIIETNTFFSKQEYLDWSVMLCNYSFRNYFRIISRKRHCVFVKLTREIRVGNLHDEKLLTTLLGDDFTCHNLLIRGYIRS